MVLYFHVAFDLVVVDDFFSLFIVKIFNIKNSQKFSSKQEDLSSYGSQIQRKKRKSCERERETKVLKMDRFDGPPRLMLVTDLDCTLVITPNSPHTHF